MSHVLRHHGNNSLTYSFIKTGSGDYLSRADWLALPNSRIKSALLQSYPGNFSQVILNGMVGLAEKGFAATLLTGDVLGTPSLSFIAAGGPTEESTTIIGYEIDVPNGTAGILRISLAYSASE